MAIFKKKTGNIETECYTLSSCSFITVFVCYFVVQFCYSSCCYLVLVVINNYCYLQLCRSLATIA